MPYARPARLTHIDRSAAHEAAATGSRTPRRAPLRRALTVLIGLAVLLPVASIDAPSVSSATNSCTGWSSRDVPPETIRVGRRDGSVETVEFRTYVGVVMAKEWPGWVPEEAREAGAVAVKQFAWFHSLEGAHRSNYVNAQGKCYDVTDGTADQLYRPEEVSPGEKIWRVVDRTWGLSVRKAGYFFLTGYRTGDSKVCASDVDGYRLYAKSVINCAYDGWSRKQIQSAYYAPNVTFHWATPEATLSPPLDVPIDPPTADLRTGKTLATKQTWIIWDRDLARPPGASYQLQRRVKGDWSNVSLADPTRPRVALNLKRGISHKFRVRLRDSKGNTGPWHAGPEFDARLIQDTNDRMGWSPDAWQRQKKDSASGGTVTYATEPESQAALTFTGRAVAIISSTGPDRGRAKIYVDGQLEGEVDLYSPKYRSKVLVFTREWAKSESRVIRVDVEGTKDRSRVDIDAILFYR